MDAMAMVSQNGRSSRARQAAVRGSPRKRASSSRRQVLVIENLRGRSQLLNDMLVQERFEVGGIEDAREALQLLSHGFLFAQGKVPELIICNAQMLGEAGLEVLAQLCAWNPGVSVILYSAFVSPKLRERMARVEGAWVLEQPFNLEHLRSLVVSVAASREAVF
jgi:DNA-binding NtrC family response regulator